MKQTKSRFQNISLYNFLIVILLTSCNINNESISEFDNFSKENYIEMLSNVKKQTDLILLMEKPDTITLEAYKLMLLEGKIILSLKAEEELLKATNILERYGKFLVEKHQLSISIIDKNDLIAVGGLFEPNDELLQNKAAVKYLGISQKMELEDFLKCAAVAVGADALFALGGSSATAWSAAALKRAFSAVAKRFLGPIGVAIAVVSFSLCLAESA